MTAKAATAATAARQQKERATRRPDEARVAIRREEDRLRHEEDRLRNEKRRREDAEFRADMRRLRRPAAVDMAATQASSHQRAPLTQGGAAQREHVAGPARMSARRRRTATYQNAKADAAFTAHQARPEADADERLGSITGHNEDEEGTDKHNEG